MAKKLVHLGTQIVCQYGFLDEEGNIEDRQSAQGVITTLRLEDWAEACKKIDEHLKNLSSKEADLVLPVLPP